MKCVQILCANPCVVRFTWPGKDEAFACREHADYMASIADAIGMHLQLIDLPSDRVTTDTITAL